MTQNAADVRGVIVFSGFAYVFGGELGKYLKFH